MISQCTHQNNIKWSIDWKLEGKIHKKYLKVVGMGYQEVVHQADKRAFPVKNRVGDHLEKK